MRTLVERAGDPATRIRAKEDFEEGRDSRRRGQHDFRLQTSALYISVDMLQATPNSLEESVLGAHNTVGPYPPCLES